jgi:hypothetical protein
MRWTDSAAKRRWMHSRALLLEIIGDDSAILKTDGEREEYNSVCARLKRVEALAAAHLEGPLPALPYASGP